MRILTTGCAANMWCWSHPLRICENTRCMAWVDVGNERGFCALIPDREEDISRMHRKVVTGQLKPGQGGFA